MFAAIDTYKCLCFTQKEFHLEFTENVNFSKLKEFILSKRNNDTTKREIQDKIENACWNAGKMHTVNVHFGHLKCTNSGLFLTF